MKIKNKERARLALAELEKEMEVLTKEQMNACKGGGDYVPPLSGYTAGFSNLGGGFSSGIYIPPQYQGSTGYLGGSGSDDDPYRLSEVVVVGTRPNRSNFGGSLYYTGGGSFYSGGYGPHLPEGMDPSYGSGGGGGTSSPSNTDSNSWNTFVNGVGAFTFANGVKAELIGWAETLNPDDFTAGARKYLKFSERLGYAGAAIQIVSSSINIANDYSSGGISNINGWDVADVVVATGSTAVAIFVGATLVGWAVAAASGGYYLYRTISSEME